MTRKLKHPCFQITPREAIQRAIEALGAPVASSAPAVALAETDKKITRAVAFLVYALEFDSRSEA